ncbi:MAG: aminopeptidase P N-terminal domain-containing protein [Pirellulales bacterium]
MRHHPIDSQLFVENRDRLRKLLPPNSLAAVNANDVLPTNADGSLPLVPNNDLFYLSGVEQEESLLVLAPDAADEKLREILFLREPNEHLKTWEGYKLSKDDATKISGVRTVKWLSELPGVWHGLMCDAEQVFLNSNEHKRAVVEVETRDARFVDDCKRRYPLHTYRRLAPLLHKLRVVKSAREIELLKEAIRITDAGFRRVCQAVRPGVAEFELEAEFAHEFVRNRAKFAYTPIIASAQTPASCTTSPTINRAGPATCC